MIAGENRLLLVKREAEVIRDMTRGVESFDGPAGPGDDVAVAQAVIGFEVDVHALVRLLAIAIAIALASRVGRMRPGERY